MEFRVDLELFRGPLDLLLYLVRKHEVDIADLPIATLTEQYLQYLDVLETLNVDDVGDFLEVASTLLEIKSRQVLPVVEETAEVLDDPREELVERLLEYKRFKDAAVILEEQSRQWQQHYPRQASDLPPRETDLGSQPIQELELWDLVSAFGRMLREKQSAHTANIVYDDTPIHVYMRRLHQTLTTEGRAALSEMLTPGLHKSAMIGIFLAILELVRHHSVRTEQTSLHGEIYLIRGPSFSAAAEFSQADSYDHPALSSADLPVKPR